MGKDGNEHQEIPPSIEASTDVALLLLSENPPVIIMAWDVLFGDTVVAVIASCDDVASATEDVDEARIAVVVVISSSDVQNPPPTFSYNWYHFLYETSFAKSWH